MSTQVCKISVNEMKSKLCTNDFFLSLSQTNQQRLNLIMKHGLPRLLEKSERNYFRTPGGQKRTNSVPDCGRNVYLNC